MKIVVNKCYGGFSISTKCLDRYAELLGKKVYHFTHDYTKKYKSFEDREYIPFVGKGKRDEIFVYSFTVPNPNDFDQNILWKKHHMSNSPDDRTDKLLIQAIEEVGVEESSGSYAKLEIIEIPDNVDWEIDEYDGFESVHEKHRSW